MRRKRDARRDKLGFDFDESLSEWEEIRRREDEWNAKSDRVSCFWRVVVAIVVGALVVLALL